jgi:type VI secretion system protein ImpC
MPRIAVIGDLSGDGERPPGAEPRPRTVDLDSLDARIAELSPSARLDLPFCGSVAFASWNDFLPDALLGRVPALRGLLEAREAADDPDTVASLLREAGAEPELIASSAGREADIAPAAGATPPRSPRDGASLLDDLLDGEGARPAAPGRPALESDPQFARVLAQIADASVDRVDRQLRERWQGAIEVELARRLRAILRHPRFRALESLWSAVRELVRAAERDEDLLVTLTDLSRRTLAESRSPGDTVLRALSPTSANVPGGEPPLLALSDLAFGPGDSDLELLEQVAGAAARACVPVLAEAHEELWSNPAARAQRWQSLQATDGAQWVGLCCPRVLLRVPYGPNTWAIDSFEFDELGDEPSAPDAFTWSASAPLLALAATRALAEGGSLRALPQFGRLESLPFTHVRVRGELEPRGPTEQLLAQSDLERLVADGLIPLAGILGSDSAQLVAFPAIAGTPLFDVQSW